jgi:hypothetical protein
MAKAKKTESSGSAPKAPKSAAKKSTKAKPAMPAAPLIDTGLAAEAAAKNLVAKVTTGGPGGAASQTPAKESAGFKNLKASLAHPAGHSMASLLDKTAVPGQKKSNLPFHGGKQVGRNQTFGADVNRAGVPRRTGG